MAVEAKDPYTHGHSDRVTTLAVMLARKLGFGGDQLNRIRFGCILHDIGKLATPIEILQKPGQLTAQEYDIIKQHTVAGARIIEGLDFLEEEREIVLHHHERYDGEGYPGKLAGEEIPLGARICAVADAYDAMTSRRPYREAMSRQEAQAELLRGSGLAHDPSLVAAFVDVLAQEGERCLKSAA
jgi:putative nucleotidyltransferase with HDIG domain